MNMLVLLQYNYNFFENFQCTYNFQMKWDFIVSNKDTDRGAHNKFFYRKRQHSWN